MTDRYSYRPAIPAPGFSYGLTTYLGDGTPLPRFAGDPPLMPCDGCADDLLSRYWDALDNANRVALAIKHVPTQGDARIRLRHRG